MSKYSLSHLSDAALLQGFAALIATERDVTAAQLAHIDEIDARRLYAPEGYPSLHAYCVGRIKLSEDAARKRPVVYDKDGDAHYDFVSAFIKAIRGSDPDAALYYLASMLEGGEDPRYIARRLIVHASEDIGMADSRALLVATAAAHAVEHVGLPEARLNLAHATIYLARAPKSNASYKAYGEAAKDVRELGNILPPKSLRDGSWYGRQLGHGKGYVYPHSDPAGFEFDHLPDELKGRKYYRPSAAGEEAERLRRTEFRDF